MPVRPRLDHIAQGWRAERIKIALMSRYPKPPFVAGIILEGRRFTRPDLGLPRRVEVLIRQEWARVARATLPKWSSRAMRMAL